MIFEPLGVEYLKTHPVAELLIALNAEERPRVDPADWAQHKDSDEYQPRFLDDLVLAKVIKPWWDTIERF